MILIFVGVFLFFALSNLYRARNLIIRPGIIKMDWISLAFVWLIFIVFSLFVGADRTDTILMVLTGSLYVLSSRLGRGIEEDGVILQAGSPFTTRRYKFADLKQVNLSEDQDLLAFSIVTKTNGVDIQRYPKSMKDEIVKIFRDNNISIIYK